MTAYNGTSPPGLRMDISYATGFVVETGFYCAYVCLFIAAFPGMIKARRLKDSRSARSAWVFLIFSGLMYLMATIHLVCAAIRFYKSTFSNIDPKGPISYLQNPNHWDYLALVVLLCVQTWLGDALVIYRCYYVWENNVWVIIAPVCLLLGTIIVNVYLMYWFRHPLIISFNAAFNLLDSVYPLAFAQNFITTSLIVLKIFLRHQASKKARIVDVGSKLSLIRIARIIIESAAIYTAQLLVINILYFRDDNFQYVVQPAVVPSIGITFVLLALRIEASRNEGVDGKNDFGIRSSMIPRWLSDDNRDAGPQDRQHTISLQLQAVDGPGVNAERLAVEGDTGTVNWNSGISTDSAIEPKEGACSLGSSKDVSPSASELAV